MEVLRKFSDIKKLADDISNNENIETVGIVSIYTGYLIQEKTKFHEGHFDLLQKAKNNCDVLILLLVPRIHTEHLLTKSTVNPVDAHEYYKQNGITEDLEEISKFAKSGMIINQNKFIAEFRKLQNLSIIDYIVSIDTTPAIINQSVNHMRLLDERNLDFHYKKSNGDFIYIADSMFRCYYYIIDLLKTNKIKIFSVLSNVYEALINYNLSKDILYMVNSDKYIEPPDIILSPPYRDENGMLPVRYEDKTKQIEVNGNDNYYDERMTILNYFKSSKIKYGYSANIMKDKYELNNRYRNEFKIFFKDLDTLSILPVVRKRGILTISSVNHAKVENKQGGRTEEKILVGIDEKKWHKISSEGLNTI